ncbi:MAG: response regulator [Candidatus Omnitrophota bacterium]
MGKKKILLVDDEVDFLILMKKIIISWGYDIITASNSQEALAAFQKEKPNILIVDYAMPEVNGIELLEKIRSLVGGGVPAIMFAAEPSMKAMEKAKDLRISAFIPKISPRMHTHEDLKMALDLIAKGI